MIDNAFWILKQFDKKTELTVSELLSKINSQKTFVSFTQIQNVVNSVTFLKDKEILEIKGGKLCLKLKK